MCECDKDTKGSHYIGSGYSRLNINIWEPQYDQSKFLGRTRHYYKLYHPCHFFTSEQSLENARKIMERYRNGDPMDDVTVNQLWKAKYLYESTFDSCTDDKALILGRPSGYVPWTTLILGGMSTYFHCDKLSTNTPVFQRRKPQLPENHCPNFFRTSSNVESGGRTNRKMYFGVVWKTFDKIASQAAYSERIRSVPPIMFWQWSYQTFRLAENYTTRPYSSQRTDEELIYGYAAGTTGAVATALLYHKRFKCAAPFIARMGPLLAVMVANCITVPVTRFNDMKEGIPIYDSRGKQLAISTTAAKWSVLLETVRQLLIVAPPLALAPFYMEYLEERGTLCRYPYLTLPHQMLFLALYCTLISPFFRAIFTDESSIPFSSLQSNLQDCIIRSGVSPPEEIYFKLGM